MGEGVGEKGKRDSETKRKAVQKEGSKEVTEEERSFGKRKAVSSFPFAPMASLEGT